MHAHPATANPMALHGNHGRVSPKVPGLNAQPLGPSIGTDHWRVSATEKRRRNASIRQARPVSGRGSQDLVPVSGRTRPKRPKTRTVGAFDAENRGRARSRRRREAMGA